MKAIVQDAYGGPEVLGVRDVPRPEIGDDEVLVRVAAASLDRRVMNLVRGDPLLVRLMGFGVRRPKRPVPRSDVAGTVEAVGANVTRFSAGDEVYGIAEEVGLAEYARAKEQKVAPMPAHASPEQACTIPYGGLTALQGLRDRGKVEAGQRVLIVGASGAVGTFAVQFAKAFGAEVTAVCSTASLDLVRKLGADHVVDYTEERFDEGSTRYDVIVDIAGDTPVRRLRRVLVPRGRLVIVGGEVKGRVLGIGRQIRATLLSPFVSHKMGMFIANENADDMVVINELIDAGTVTPVVDRAVGFEHAADALREIDERRTRDRIVLRV